MATFSPVKDAEERHKYNSHIIHFLFTRRNVHKQSLILHLKHKKGAIKNSPQLVNMFRILDYKIYLPPFPKEN